MKNTLSFLLCVLCVLSGKMSSARAGTATELLTQSHTTGGLVVVLGSGNGQLALDLAAANPTLVVHALDADPANVTAARIRFLESDAATRLSAELLSAGDPLPHADKLVNLLLVSGGASLPDAEAMRVLAPGGTLLRESGGQWTAAKAPPHDPLGDWTHYQFDASNNMVGTDPDCGLPRRFQWTGKPLWTTSHENMASVNAMVSANGRVFYIIDEGPRASIQLPADWQLVARDAYNGVILWKKPIEQWLTRFWPWKSGPAQMPRKLIATANPDRVYSVLDINGPLMEFDAASGELLRTFEGTAAAEEFIHTDGILLVQVNLDPSNQSEIEEERRARRGFSYDGRDRAVLDHDVAKKIVAIEVATGKQLWSRPGPRVLPLTLGAKNGNVVYHDGERLVCLDLHTGNEKWKSDPITGRLHTVSEEAPTTVVDDKVVFFAWNKFTTTVSIDDGRTLWTSDWTLNDYRSPVTLMVMNDLVWSLNIAQAKAPGTFTGRDPVSGEILKQFDLPPFQGIGHHRCYKAKASGDYVLLSRSGVEYVDPSTESYAEHHWVRGACLYGILPANGMLYSTPHACACYIKGKLNGFTAMTPGPTGPSPLAKPGEGPTEKGPAYDAIHNLQSTIDNSSDWPTYRGDVARSGRSATKVTTDLKQTWETQIGGDLSAPTIGAGMVYVVQKDTNTVHALDSKSGEPAWAFTAGGTLDSPPTLDQGRLYFGSADGNVYCLNAGDGVLAWRTRVAPFDRRVIAYGRVESAWPVNGSVLVQSGAVFCCAGRSSFLDGGIRIAKLDAESGSILLTQNVYDLDENGKEPPLEGSFDMAGALPDVLSGDGASVFMRHLRFGTEILDPQPQAPHLFAPTGYLDANWWHRTHWVYGANTKGGYGGWWQEGNKLPAGRLMVVGEDTVYCFGREFYAGMNSAQFARGEKYILYAAEKREGPEPDWAALNAERRRLGDLAIEWKKYRTTPIKWQGQVSFNIRAMALADKTLFTSGPYGDALRSMDAHLGKNGVRLAATDVTTGEMVANWAIGAVPVFDGLAAAGGSLYLAGLDGSVRSFGSKGAKLESRLGEPIEEIHEELLQSDEEYRKETQEFLGNPADDKPKGKGKAKGKSAAAAPRTEVQGQSLASQFTAVTGGKVVAGELGYRLGADTGQVALALNRLEKPVTTRATWELAMKTAEGFDDYSYRNGFLAFGDGDTDEQLIKCGIQFVQGTLRIIEGPTGNAGPKAKLSGDLGRTFTLTVTVDLAGQAVTLNAANQTLTHKLDRPLKEITHLGYASWNAVTDFGKL